MYTLTIKFNIAPGYEIVTVGFFGFVVFIRKFSGNDAGRIHQIPSVSNSKGRLKAIKIR